LVRRPTDASGYANEDLTPLGHHLAKLPVDVRVSKLQATRRALQLPSEPPTQSARVLLNRGMYVLLIVAGAICSERVRAVSVLLDVTWTSRWTSQWT